MAQNENKAFIMYDSFIKAMKNLNGDDFKECVLAMADYAINGIEPTSENPMIKIILTMALPNIDAAQKRHLQAVENGSKGKEFGKQGGRPRKEETPEQYHQRKLEETPKKPLKKERKEEIKNEIEIKTKIDNKVNTGGLDYSGLDSSFSFSSPLQGANLNGYQASTGTEKKPVNGQQDAKQNSQPVRNTGLEQAKNENKTVISTPEQELAKQEYFNGLYKVAAQAFGEVQTNYITILSTPENYGDKAGLILDKSGDYLFEQYQNRNNDEQAFGRIINALARYRLQLPEEKNVVVDVFKFLLRREYEERSSYQEQGLDYDEVYG